MGNCSIVNAILKIYCLKGRKKNNNDEIVCRLNKTWVCVHLPSSRNEVTQVQVSSFRLEHGLVVVVCRETEAHRPRSVKSAAAVIARPKRAAMTSRRLSLFRKGAATFAKMLSDLIWLCSDTARGISRDGERVGAAQVRVLARPNGSWTWDDACIFQQYVPDGQLMRDLNSGRSEEKEKEKQRKKKQLQMTT